MKRLMELDGIRGIAALAVVCFHLAPGFTPLGWVAVDCFFVLSGYLISAILLANRGDPHYFFNFYVRRSLRIWPIYYLTLLPILAAYRLKLTNYPINSGILLQYLTYTQNIQHIWFDTADRAILAYSHTWTLAIEEQFYMLWPLMVRTVPSSRAGPSMRSDRRGVGRPANHGHELGRSPGPMRRFRDGGLAGPHHVGALLLRREPRESSSRPDYYSRDHRSHLRPLPLGPARDFNSLGRIPISERG